MRPRVFPAEDAGEVADREASAAAASMRPRVFPAEDTRAILDKNLKLALQ